MKVRALTSFCGKITMAKGEICQISDKDALDDLLRAGFIEEVKEDEQKKSAAKSRVSKNENK